MVAAEETLNRQTSAWVPATGHRCTFQSSELGGWTVGRGVGDGPKSRSVDDQYFGHIAARRRRATLYNDGCSVSPSCLPKTNTSNITNTNATTPTSTTTININVTTLTTTIKISNVTTTSTSSDIKTIISSKPTLENNSETFQHMHRHGKHYIKCIACNKYPDIVKKHTIKSQIPKITQDLGALFRQEVIDNHLTKPYHTISIKMLRLSTLPNSIVQQSTQMGRAILKANEKLGNKIGSLMIHTYGDAKKLTLSAYTYPMRVITSQMASNFTFNELNENITYDFQYLTPASHKEFLQCIVKSYKKTFSDKLISETISMSLRCDGSVDRSQIDKIYIILKTVSLKGVEEQYFLGAGQVEQRGAEGILDAIETACINNVGHDVTEYIFKNISSIVTDGAAVNIGSKGGLWTLVENKWRNNSNKSNVPLVKIWCAVHRSNLAWKDVSSTVVEVSHIVSKLSGISAFFHNSALRTRELQQLSKENNLQLIRIPKFFQVRWTEFSFSLVNAILISWKALVIYMRNSKEKESNGFLLLLTNKDTIFLLAFLADVLAIFSRYQQTIQSDKITVLDLVKHTESVINKIKSLSSINLVGGWVDVLEDELKGTDGKVLKDIKLIDFQEKRKHRHNLYVTENRSVSAIDIDKYFVSTIKPVANLDSKANIRNVFDVLGKDLDLADLNMEYTDLMEHNRLEEIRQMPLPKLVQYLSGSKEFKNITILLARVIAAKPHSADVERLISKSNILKSINRQCLHVETENEYLFIHFNMPALQNWGPRPAIQIWLNQNERRIKETPKAKEQEWFSGIFMEATKRKSEDQTEQTIKKRMF
ncbi:hypothetical protein ACI65C_001361 [Semiaphis heraclei]